MNQDGKSNNKNSDNKSGIARFCLEMELVDFFEEQSSFFNDLASILNILPEEIRITGINFGCILIRVEIPIFSQIKLTQKWNSEYRPIELLSFIKKYNIRWIRFDDMVEKRFSIIIPLYKNAKKQVTWLHLSDLHIRSDKGAKQWLQDMVIQKFIDDLPKLLSNNHLEPDVIFFTGDIAFSGKTEEYQHAKEIILEIVAKLKLRKEPKIFFVPGNHDVAWEKIDSKYENKIRKKLINQKEILSLLLDAAKNKDRNYLFERQQNYFDFIKSIGFSVPTFLSSNPYYYVSLINHDGLEIGVVGLNSSWLSTRKDLLKAYTIPDRDLQNLILGEPFIFDAIERLKNADLKIVLLHHPPFSMWFNEIDQTAQNKYLPEFHFILRGHEHREKFDSLSPTIQQQKVAHHFAAGALYQTNDFLNNFNAVKLNIDQEVGTMYFWTYFNNYNAWRPYTGPAEEGYSQFRFQPR